MYVSAINEEGSGSQMAFSSDLEEELLLIENPLCGLTGRSQSMGLQREKPLLKFRRCAGKTLWQGYITLKEKQEIKIMQN